MLEENQHLWIKFKSQYAHISWFRITKADLIKKNGCIKHPLNYGILGVNKGLFTINNILISLLHNPRN